MEIPYLNTSLSDIWGTSSNDIFAVGFQGNILHFDGMNWERMPSNTTENLKAVWGTSSNNVYAAGSNGTIIHYDGVDWSKITSFTLDDLLDIWGSAANNIYISGENFLLHFDGNNWSFVNELSQMCASENYGCGDFRSIWGTSANNIFTGQAHFNGTRWSKVKSDSLNFYPIDIWGTSSTGIYAVVEGFISKYNGTMWTELIDTYTFGNYNAIFGIDYEIFLLGRNELRYINTYIPIPPQPWTPLKFSIAPIINLLLNDEK